MTSAPHKARIPLHHLRLKPNVAAGLNPLLLFSLAYRLRSTTDDVTPAIVRANGPEDYTVLDGRHRFLAAVIAGRHELLCEVES